MVSQPVIPLSAAHHEQRLELLGQQAAAASSAISASSFQSFTDIVNKMKLLDGALSEAQTHFDHLFDARKAELQAIVSELENESVDEPDSHDESDCELLF